MLEQVQAPASEPITLADVKELLKIDGGSEDAFLTRLISVAREHVETMTGLALIDQGWRLVLPAWPGPLDAGDDWLTEADYFAARAGAAVPILIGKRPHVRVTAVVVVSPDGDDAEIEPASWAVMPDTAGARLIWRGASAPPRPAAGGWLEIRFTSGFGTAPTSVPADLRHGIESLVGHLYEHRELAIPEALAIAPAGAYAAIRRRRSILA